MNVSLNVCLHFDQILKRSYICVDAYIFLQAVKLSYLRWHPKWPPEKNNKKMSSLFVYYCCKLDTKYHMVHLSKCFLYIGFELSLKILKSAALTQCSAVILLM